MTAAEHAQVVRHALDSGQWGDVRDALAALDALVAQVEQLQRLADDRLTLMKSEGEGWRAECDELKARAEQLQRERNDLQRIAAGAARERDEARDEVVRLAGRTEQLDDALEDAHNAAITFFAQARARRAGMTRLESFLWGALVASVLIGGLQWTM